MGLSVKRTVATFLCTIHPDIFVHYSSIDAPGFKTLDPGEEVLFEVEDTDRGPEARNVKRQ